MDLRDQRDDSDLSVDSDERDQRDQRDDSDLPVDSDFSSVSFVSAVSSVS